MIWSFLTHARQTCVSTTHHRQLVPTDFFPECACHATKFTCARSAHHFWWKAGCCHILPFPAVIPQYCWWRGDTQLSFVWPRMTTFDKITRGMRRGWPRSNTPSQPTPMFENPTYTHTVWRRAPKFGVSKSSHKFVTLMPTLCDLYRRHLHTVRETSTIFCMMIKRYVRKILQGLPRMLTRALFAVTNLDVVWLKHVRVTTC